MGLGGGTANGERPKTKYETHTQETREKREEEREVKESRDKIHEGQKPRDQRQGNEKGD